MKRLQIIVLSLLYLTAAIAQTKNDSMNSILNKVNADRNFFNSLGNIYPANSSVDIASEPIDGVSCYWFVPDNFTEGNIVIYLHGGSFALGSIQSHKAMVSHIASALSTKVLFIKYALAPERPFPNGLNEVLKVYRELITKYPKASISIIGDSAGGGLAVSLMHKAIEVKLQMPSSIILISPWINLKCNFESQETRKKLDPILTKSMLLEYADYYVADNRIEADPDYLTFTTFPPLFILVGSNEILFDDAKTFYNKIKPLQPNTKMKEYIHENHVCLLTDIESKGSIAALKDMREFLTQTTKH